jgi:hypothetical protein
MKFAKTFREVYEPYLSKLGYFWYKKYFVRVDSKQELLSLVCHRNYSRSGLSQYPISVGAGHFPLGGLDVDQLDLRGFDSISEILYRNIEVKANRKYVQFTADDRDETTTRAAFESSLNFFLTYCPDIFEVGEMPDNLEVYDRIRNRLVENEMISEIVTKLGPMPTFELETYIWLRDYEKARRFIVQSMEELLLGLDKTIEQSEAQIAYIEGTAESINEYERNYIRRVLKSPKRRQAWIDSCRSQVEIWVNHKRKIETDFRVLLETLDNNPESKWVEIDELRKSNLRKLNEYENKLKRKKK